MHWCPTQSSLLVLASPTRFMITPEAFKLGRSNAATDNIRILAEGRSTEKHQMDGNLSHETGCPVLSRVDQSLTCPDMYK